MCTQSLDQLRNARYVLLRTFRSDGIPVDTPVWFKLDGNTLLFRTKVGPKTRRLSAQPHVELTACDYRGRPGPHPTMITGRATILTDRDAETANRRLHERYGWQWNIVPLVKIPGITNVHQKLSVRGKLQRARDRRVWPDSVIVRVNLGLPNRPGSPAPATP